jgi:hypothetical protein
MTDSLSNTDKTTAVDDVRYVREKIAAQHGGDIRAHMAETNRLFEQLNSKLKPRVVPTPPSGEKRNGTLG